LFLHVGSECNLKCQHCHFWLSHTKHDPKRISVEMMDEIIAEFAEMNPSGKVVMCGGEPMLEYTRYIGVCLSVRRHGLRVFNATNGYGVHSSDRAQDLLTRGPHELTLSLDSHIPEIHDEIRGRVGSYNTAVLAVRRLVAAKKVLGLTSSKINVMVLLTSATFDHLRDLYQLVLRDLGADKLKVNGLQPSFGVHSGTTPSDDFFATYSQLDVARLREELLFCNVEFSLNLNPIWIEQFCGYYLDLQGRADMRRGWELDLRTSEHICNCYERNLVVGLYGEVGHCYSFQNFLPVQYRQPGDLTRFWESNNQRDAMKSCNRLCSIGHSNRNVSASLVKLSI
jgi:MoaA/NifB/PqqE/SkfB family radical SAM enzyme